MNCCNLSLDITFNHVSLGPLENYLHDSLEEFLKESPIEVLEKSQIPARVSEEIFRGIRGEIQKRKLPE